LVKDAIDIFNSNTVSCTSIISNEGYPKAYYRGGILCKLSVRESKRP
jgi:hypothetical protein